ncbi:hypothetical protein HED63_28090 [Ochrobactrum cytisi]|nr:hypothetical protein [Brucella cytisi]
MLSAGRSLEWSQPEPRGKISTFFEGRLLEVLYQERIDIASTLGPQVRTIFEHFHLSFHFPVSSISQMSGEMHTAGNGGTGQATADSRYVTEDVPFGLAMTAKLGRLVGKPAELHETGVKVFSAMYGRDFSAENDLLSALTMDVLVLEELVLLCKNGYPAGT